jgi:NitT/TauT family transport system substrate-binding protein
MLQIRHIALLAAAALATAPLAPADAGAAERIRVAVQRTGTLAWELDVIRTHGLDRKANLQIDTIELASTEAGKIALKGGSADLMLSDWRGCRANARSATALCSIRRPARSAP